MDTRLEGFINGGNSVGRYKKNTFIVLQRAKKDWVMSLSLRIYFGKRDHKEHVDFTCN